MAFGDTRLPERFWQKIAITPDGCWLWTGYTDRLGYGRFLVDRKPKRVHSVSYRTLIGEVDRELVLDHLCRNRSCSNPDHLEMVTQRENILRGVGWAGLHARQTHCKQGHPLDGENLRIEKNGKANRRRCLTCARSSNAKTYSKSKDQKNERARARYKQQKSLGGY